MKTYFKEILCNTVKNVDKNFSKSFSELNYLVKDDG